MGANAQVANATISRGVRQLFSRPLRTEGAPPPSPAVRGRAPARIPSGAFRRRRQPLLHVVAQAREFAFRLTALLHAVAMDAAHFLDRLDQLLVHMAQRGDVDDGTLVGLRGSTDFS